ncbi:MAG TPA: hypothetical protein VGN80_08480 [Devosiaceae bacterium]|jgi:hypothetical protein|nr:hypothetical protein [Devosiaceae bacterium]
MNTSIIAATALAVLALAPIATATSVQAQQQPPTHRIPTPDPDPAPATTYSCTEELGHLRRVYATELAAIDHPNKVWVTPICVNLDSVFRTDGNAGSLRAAIAANPAIQYALAAKDFRPEDVVGVRMTGEDKGTIYVHPFHR